MQFELFEHIKTIYRNAFEHLRESWLKLLVWTAAWFILSWILQGNVDEEAKMIQILSDLKLEHADVTTSFIKTIISYLLMLIGAIFLPYSLFALALKTNDDPDTPWATCGIQGILHPWQSLKVGALFEVLRQLVMTGGVYLMIFLIMTMCRFPQIVYTFGAIAIILYIYVLLRFSLSWFNMIDMPEYGALHAIKKSYEDTKGRVGYLCLTLLPVLALSIAFFAGAGVCDKKHHEAFDIEVEMAKHAVQAIQTTLEEDQEYIAKLETSAYNDLDIARLKNAMSNKFFQDPVPEYEDYDGDPKAFIAALADYGMRRDSFEANRDNREISEITQAYLDRPVSGSRWLFLGFLCKGLIIGLMTIGLSLMVQFYRTIEALPMPSPKKHNSNDEEPDSPELLREPPKAEETIIDEPAQTSEHASKDEMPAFVMPEISIPDFSDSALKDSSHTKWGKDTTTLSSPGSVSQENTTDAPIRMPKLSQMISEDDNNTEKTRLKTRQISADEVESLVRSEEMEVVKDNEQYAEFFKPKVPKGPANIIQR
ncbi:MAG: hypothetical protein J6S69_11145 [Proteobacteria bacterium]|nr:hypothetical protein [Pseudomonadota bacterium]